LRKYADDQKKITPRNNAYPENDDTPKPLPLQGSCATVYDIAPLLLKQCVELKYFDGGLLACQINFESDDSVEERLETILTMIV
jgi:hypothetical protein